MLPCGFTLTDLRLSMFSRHVFQHSRSTGEQLPVWAAAATPVSVHPRQDGCACRYTERSIFAFTLDTSRKT